MATRGFNRWRLAEWGDPRGTVTALITSPGECVSRVNVHAKEAFRLLLDLLYAWGYDVSSCGSYSLRRITNGSVWSSHAWGIAMDINPGSNPYTRQGLVTDIPLDLIREVYRIRTMAGHRVFKWGGDWDGDFDFDEHTVWDAMHFELLVTPGEIAAGVFYDGRIETEVSPTMFIKKGAKGAVVTYWQLRLKRLMPGALPRYGVDGDYGNEVATAVKALVPGSDGQQIGPKEAEVLDALAGANAPTQTDHVDEQARRLAIAAKTDVTRLRTQLKSL